MQTKTRRGRGEGGGGMGESEGRASVSKSRVGMTETMYRLNDKINPFLSNHQSLTDIIVRKRNEY